MKHEFNPLDDRRLNDIEPWAAEIGKPDITGLMMRIPPNKSSVLPIVSDQLPEKS